MFLYKFLINFLHVTFLVLSSDMTFSVNSTLFNSNTFETKVNVKDICGANFCPGITVDINPNLEPPAPEKIQLISGIYLGCMVAACLIVAFGVDSLSRLV